MPLTSGAMIRDARARARLSQTDLARRAGVAQSVISAYESDRREPGLRTLTKLIEATGHRLVIDLVPSASQQLGLPDTPLGRRLRRRRRTIVDLAARHRARNVRVFGSVARGDDDAGSDVDFLVDLDDGVGLVALAALERELTDLVGTRVDVVPAAMLKRGIRDEVLAEAIPL
jgi:predicted nucleotidyltransferase/DNA-binding XRE family transcriptional regulator